jgi:hypothetical protein
VVSFNPMMMINRSETCATRRLYQCRQFGVYENDISRKFYQNPEDVPDLAPADFLARKAVVEQLQTWSGDNAKKEERVHRNEWVPILYAYEVSKLALSLFQSK